MIQGSVEWHSARLGKVTASRVADVIARTKTGWGASRANYMAELVCERLTGSPALSFSNAAMQWGVDTEPFARSAYAVANNLEVMEVGFIDHPEIINSGASPDGLIGFDGLVEIKCPQTATHIETLLSQRVPEKYLTQTAWQMACTGRKWCDFVSFDPRLPEEMQLFVQRIERDDALILDLESHVADFLAELDGKIIALKEFTTARAGAGANNAAPEAA